MQAKLKLSARAEPGRDPLVADRDPEGQTLADWNVLASKIEARGGARRIAEERLDAAVAQEQRIRREVSEAMEIDRRLPAATDADRIKRAYRRVGVRTE